MTHNHQPPHADTQHAEEERDDIEDFKGLAKNEEMKMRMFMERWVVCKHRYSRHSRRGKACTLGLL